MERTLSTDYLVTSNGTLVELSKWRVGYVTPDNHPLYGKYLLEAKTEIAEYEHFLTTQKNI
jgi:hypothetical protein